LKSLKKEDLTSLKSRFGQIFSRTNLFLEWIKSTDL